MMSIRSYIYSLYKMFYIRLKTIARYSRVFINLLRAIPRAISFYDGSIYLVMHRAFRALCRDGLKGLIRRGNMLLHGVGSNRRYQSLSSVNLYGEIPQENTQFNPKVSIIVPNYNHASYLRQRLDSIYSQSYSNFEVILLDDCSNDESVSVLREYYLRYPLQTTCSFNEVNSGGVFNQWKKGLSIATGELIWIAESDDFCELTFLEELVKYFQNNAVMLAFCRTTFVEGVPPNTVWTSEEFLSELDLGIWDAPFIKSAHSLVKSGWSVKNLVPNVSSALFRNPIKMDILNDPTWLSLRVCGDWVFYLTIIRGGLVAYSPDTTNFYRQHSSNTSVNSQKEHLYYREHEVVASYLVRLFKLEISDIKKHEKHLYEHWCYRKGKGSYEEFKALYNLDKIWERSVERKPNVVMAGYALAAGGGETFPIMLANLLFQRGYPITFLNFDQETKEHGVQSMLHPLVPLLELHELELMDGVFYDMGTELIHSHHAWVDLTLAANLINSPEVRQVISMHGMYEMMKSSQLDTLIGLLKLRITSFVYTAEKNIIPFPQSFINEKSFFKIENALASKPFKSKAREELNVGIDDFLLCLVARAIPDKGWAEAIEAVVCANSMSDRSIHLLLIGEGSEYERLSSAISSEFIHFLGFKSDIRDYFSASDMGFLPSRFKGESAPLVLIDCLYSGKPVLASNIGEISNMLDSSEGYAGALFDLVDWSIPTDVLCNLIVKLANDSDSYNKMLSCVPFAAAKFDPDIMVDKYEAVYRASLV